MLLAAVVYDAVTRIGSSTAPGHLSAAAVWPATALAMALVWLGGPRMLVAVFLGELAGDLTRGFSVWLALVFATGTSAEALAATTLLRRAGFRPQMDRIRDVVALLAVAAPVSSVVGASTGVLALWAHGDIPGGALWPTWHAWWLSDVTRDVLIAPLLLVFAVQRPGVPRGWRMAETIAFIAALAGLGLSGRHLTVATAYLVLPVLIWAAVRFRQRGAVAANAALAAAGLVSAVAQTGWLARVTALERILFTQDFLAVGAVSTLVLAALMAERDRATTRLRGAEGRAQALAEEQSALGDVATAIARARPVEEVMGLIARHAGQLLGAISATVVHVDGARAETIAGWTRGTAAAVAEPRTMFAPIMLGGEDWGHLEVLGQGRSEFQYADRTLLQRLAELAELAVVNAHAHSRLLAEATTDELTGLRNQRAFHRHLADEVQRARRYRHPLSLLLLDLDGFKEINDRAGHPTGDRVLAEIARRIEARVRVEAVVARLGGDELGIVLPDCDAEAAYLVAERVREAVCASPADGRERVTVCAGVAEMRPADSPPDMVAAADVALYAAKRMGGNTCVRHTPGLPAQAPVRELSASPPPPDAARFA